jgi:hypothetical protein
MKKSIYVGLLPQGIGREVFKSEAKPTEETHGHIYPAVIGPFRTMRGARFMQKNGSLNPRCQSVADAERLSMEQPS